MSAPADDNLGPENTAVDHEVLEMLEQAVLNADLAGAVARLRDYDLEHAPHRDLERALRTIANLFGRLVNSYATSDDQPARLARLAREVAELPDAPTDLRDLDAL